MRIVYKLRLIDSNFYKVEKDSSLQSLFVKIFRKEEQMYTFKSFIRDQNCILNEMALKRSQVRSEMFHQFESILEHLVKVLVGQELNSAKENND